MAIVPRVTPTVADRPIHQQGIDVRATGDDFGAGIGRGLQNVAGGVDRVTAAIAAVQDMEDVALAKEADNSYANWLRERMYGEGGYMTLEGRAAVDGRKSFEEEADAKRREFGKGLRPGAAKKYETASTARFQSTLDQSIVHSANGRKTWFKEASAARIETFKADAIAAYSNPALVGKNIAAGWLEIDQQAEMQGWDEATANRAKSVFASEVHRQIVGRLLLDDPLKAKAYYDAHIDGITGEDRIAIDAALDQPLDDVASQRAAEAIISGGRGEPKPAAPSEAGSATVGDTGPTRTRAFLHGKLGGGKDASHVDGLSPAFADNLAALFQDAPKEFRDGLQIGSGFRSIERQAELWKEAVAKYGSEEAARKWVAPPGHSQHNDGEAVDIWYNGQRLDKAPKEVRDWVHQNAARYGLVFPMDWESWHIEPAEARSTPGRGSKAVPAGPTRGVRTALPSWDEIEAQLQAIPDLRVRDLTRKRINAYVEAQSKAAEAAQKAAKAEVWRMIDTGSTPDEIPFEVRQAAGMEAISAAWSYVEARAKGDTVDDYKLATDLRLLSATDPAGFAEIDLNDYRGKLSEPTIKELVGYQREWFKDRRTAETKGAALTSAYSQAKEQLEAVGITTTGKKGSQLEEAQRLQGQFQNALFARIEEFRRLNSREPTQEDIQGFINTLLLPIVIKTPPGKVDLFGLKFDWGGGTRNARLFEAGGRGDGATAELNLSYEDIPIDVRDAIRRDLALELGRQPSTEEIVTRYEDVALSQ